MKIARSVLICLIGALPLGCAGLGGTRPAPEAAMRLGADEAARLASLPLACVHQQYPNKLGQTLGGAQHLAEPRSLHPAFYGCFDWHSSVHGHWSMVVLLTHFPDLLQADELRAKLAQSLSAENVLAEVRYLDEIEASASWERTYGWAWLLKLDQALHAWDDPLGRTLAANLAPLSERIVQRYLAFLPKLVYPIRVGEHSNTAFGLAFAWDYAVAREHAALRSAVRDWALAHYLEDRNCPIDWEPSGYDFLSPCLEEVDLMRRVLDAPAFLRWLDDFLPALKRTDFDWPVAEVSDRADGKLVHLDGLNFSRAWVFYGLARQHPSLQHLRVLGNRHVRKALPHLIGDDYAGGHWLGSFALQALLRP